MPIFVIKSHKKAVEISEDLNAKNVQYCFTSSSTHYFTDQVVFTQSPYSPTTAGENTAILDEIFRSMDKDEFFKLIEYVESFEDSLSPR